MAGGGVDGDLDLAVGADLDLVLQHDLGLFAGRPPHHGGMGRMTAPLGQAGIPVVIGGEPPVAGAVEPVPARRADTSVLLCGVRSTLYLTLALVTVAPK